MSDCRPSPSSRSIRPLIWANLFQKSIQLRTKKRSEFSSSVAAPRLLLLLSPHLSLHSSPTVAPSLHFTSSSIAGLSMLRILLVLDCLLCSKSSPIVCFKPNSWLCFNSSNLSFVKQRKYITTLRELLEQLGSETTSDGISSISKAKLNEYSEKIEALAAKLASPMEEPVETVAEPSTIKEIHSQNDEDRSYTGPSAGLRRRVGVRSEIDDTSEPSEREPAALVKLDASAQAHIEKHKKLQEDLTDELVGFAQQLKESSFMMHQSLQDTEKILDSTEKAVEDSLAGTGRANTRAMQMYSESFKTTCFTWLIIFAMTSIFIMVVLLIRIT